MAKILLLIIGLCMTISMSNALNYWIVNKANGLCLQAVGKKGQPYLNGAVLRQCDPNNKAQLFRHSVYGNKHWDRFDSVGFGVMWKRYFKILRTTASKWVKFGAEHAKWCMEDPPKFYGVKCNPNNAKQWWLMVLNKSNLKPFLHHPKKCHLQHHNKWQHCCNLGSCFANKTLKQAEEVCKKNKKCEGFSFGNEAASKGHGCYKTRCGNPCVKGLGEGGYDGWVCK